jgi:hypothetical protein
VTEVQRRCSQASGEVLPGPRAWEASRAIGEANRAAGEAWKYPEGAGHGSRGSDGFGGWWCGVFGANSNELWLGQDLRARGEVRPELGAAL